MRRTAAVLTLVAVVSLLGVSDVRAGAALLPAGKTTGPGLTATIVIDVTNPPGPTNPDKGLTSIRVQKASTNVAVIFRSSYVNSFATECTAPGFDLRGTTANRFTGLIDGFVDTPSVLNALLGQFGTPSKAAITSQDYVACTSVDDGTETRQILSFTAVIQFQP
jgi:hypothetical protein